MRYTLKMLYDLATNIGILDRYSYQITQQLGMWHLERDIGGDTKLILTASTKKALYNNMLAYKQGMETWRVNEM